MQTFFNTFTGKIIRWVLLLPGAFLASTVIHFVVSIAHKVLIMFLAGMPLYDYYLEVILREIIAGGASGYAFIIAGVIIAPHFKKYIAVILGIQAMLICLLGLLGIGWSGYMNYNIISEFQSWKDVFNIIATGVGVFFAISNVFQDENNLF